MGRTELRRSELRFIEADKTTVIPVGDGDLRYIEGERSFALLANFVVEAEFDDAVKAVGPRFDLQVKTLDPSFGNDVYFTIAFNKVTAQIRTDKEAVVSILGVCEDEPQTIEQ